MWEYKIAIKFLNACSHALLLLLTGNTHFADEQWSAGHPLSSVCLNCTVIPFNNKSGICDSRVGSAGLHFPSHYGYKMATAAPSIPRLMRTSGAGRKEEKKGTFSAVSYIFLGNKTFPGNSSATFCL